MQLHVITLDTKGTTYTLYEREKTKETTKNTKQKKQMSREKGNIYLYIYIYICGASPQEMWQTLKNNELKK